MEWINVNSVEDLKEMRNFRKVKSMIKSDIKKLFEDKKSKDKNTADMITIKSGSWNGLYTKIVALREVLNYIDNELLSDENKIIKNDVSDSENNERSRINKNSEDSEKTSEGYFSSKEAEYIYYLLELDGKQRAEKLNITMKCFSDKNEAKKWRDSIVKIIHPDKCSNEKSNDAICKLNQLYEDMVAGE